jgi:hypothetical protein
MQHFDQPPWRLFWPKTMLRLLLSNIDGREQCLCHIPSWISSLALRNALLAHILPALAKCAKLAKLAMSSIWPI